MQDAAQHEGCQAMTIYIGSDHAGFELKKHLIELLQQQDGQQIEDFGTYSLESVDYPDFAQQVAQAVLKDPHGMGLVICGTGIGVSIAANRFKGIRCALCHDVVTAKLARQHNNANILALGARMLTPEQSIAIVETFFATDYEGGRHENRLIKIDKFGTDR
jgi:ribose 5-phosphate isomerase B